MASTPSLANSVATRNTSSAVIGVTTLPSAARRSLISRRQRRGASGSGFFHVRSNMVGVRMRAISSTSRNPSVVSKAVFAPTRCRMVLDAVVVPWTISVMSPGAIPVCASSNAIPSTTARAGLSGVVDVLFTYKVRSGASRTISVKVPPISQPMRTPPNADFGVIIGLFQSNQASASFCTLIQIFY